MRLQRQRAPRVGRKRKLHRRHLPERLEPRVLLAFDGLASIDLASEGWGSEAIVNDPIIGNQATAPQRQAATLLADGSGVIVYSGRGEGDRRGVFVRAVDASGVPQGDAARVNQTRRGTQANASIATLEDGTTIVAWSGRGAGDRFGVFARRMDRNGDFLSDEISINQTVRGIQTRPTIAPLENGDFVIAWTGAGVGDRSGVFVRRFDKTGNALTTETRVNPHRFGFQGSAKIAASPDGGFAVAWSGTGSGDWAGVFLRRYNADGVAVSDAIRVNATRRGVQRSPDLVVLPDGDALVVWSGRGNGDWSGIFARTVNPAGQHASPEVRVNVNRRGLQYDASIAAADDGSFLVLWSEFGGRRYDIAVKGRHFQSIESPASTPFTVPSDESGRQYSPSVVGDSRGGYLASWTRQRRWSEDVHARRLPSPTGSPDTDPPTLSLVLTADSGASSTDAITSDLAIGGTLVDASPIAALRLDVVAPAGNATSGNASSATGSYDVIGFYDRSAGTFAISDSQLRGLLSGDLADGTITLRLSATDSAGNVSDVSELIVQLDTLAPQFAAIRLAQESDSGTPGDSRTDISPSTIVGSTEPGAVVLWSSGGQQSVADSNGDFQVSSISLSPGEVVYPLQVFDAAGNVSSGSLTLFYEASLGVVESTFESRAAVNLPIPSSATSPVLRFDLQRVVDRTAVGFSSEDVLGIYVVDASDPTSALLTRADGNASLLTVSGEAFSGGAFSGDASSGDDVQFDPSLVRFDGTRVQIDLSSLIGVSEVRLVAQWINSDTDFASTAVLTGIAIDDDPDATARPAFDLPPRIIQAGPAIDLNGYSLEPSLSGVVGDVRIDPATGLYKATLRVRSGGVPTSRRVVVTLPGLASGINVVSPSGVDLSGAPYFNMAPAIFSGGLGETAESAAIEITIDNPSGQPLHLQTVVFSAGPNVGPLVNDPGPLSVVAGGYLEADFSASDPDGDLVRYSISADGGLPIAELTPEGLLRVTPAPGQEGVYSFRVVASDGFSKTVVPVSLTVTEDLEISTRISGVVLNTLGDPLAAIPIEFGSDVTVTDAAGRFELVIAPGSSADALFIRGEEFIGSEIYPFIAEKIPLLLGRDLYAGSRNVIGRPIYLPALDIANGQTIDPLRDTTVTTAKIPGASVFIRAGSLKDKNGLPFTGVLSITEVPAEVTPAALPRGLYTDLVVTIQPGEMVFETPAPITLPNRAGLAPGTEMILWSISPVTGEFEQVGIGRVNADGTLVETISGGIRNSSWHDFSTTRPQATPPDENDNNPDKECDDCANRHRPQRSGGEFNPLNSRSGNNLAQVSEPPARPSDPPPPRTRSFNLSPGGSNGFASWSGGGAARADGTVRDSMFGVATGSGRYVGSTFMSSSTANGRLTITGMFPAARRASRSVEPETPIRQLVDEPATSVLTHPGALEKTHQLAAYNSLGTGRALMLVYDSERADPRPIVHTEIRDPGRNIDSPILVSSLSVYGGPASNPLRKGLGPATTGGDPSDLALPAIQTADQYRSIGTGLTAAGAVHQISELAEYPSGRYGYTSTMRISGANNLATVGLTTDVDAKLVHVNTVDSPLGSGWGIAGLQELVPNQDGSILMIDGDGGESVYQRVEGTQYYTAPGDFSRLHDNGDGTFRRVLTDQTVYQFDANNRLESVVDRNGNATRFQYDAGGRLLNITDPVGLQTVLEYSGGRVSAIVDPANRRTELLYDNDGNLIQIVDPDSTTRSFDYDRNRRLVEETNKNGNAENIEYDFAGRISKYTRADGSSVRYSPAQTRAFVPPELTSNPLSAPPAVSLGRQAIAAVADANGNVTSTRLDRAGQVLTNLDSAGALPGYRREFNNRLTEYTDGRGNKTFLSYDDRGNTTSFSDVIARGNVGSSIFQNRVYLTGDAAAQVVLADIDGDDIVDALVSGEQSDAIFLHSGLGDGTFAPPTQIAVASVRSISVADINADGLTDITTANSNGTVSILLATGAGQFSTPVNLPVGSLPGAIMTADVDADGDLDVVVLSRGDLRMDVLLGNGDGTFAGSVDYPLSAGAVSFSLGDVDGDGNVDIVSANRSTVDNISLLRGLGDGTFAARVDMTVAPSELLAVRLGDVDSDGDLDLLATDGNTAVWAAAGLGDGTFQAAVQHDFLFPSGAAPVVPPTSILDLSDLNGDGNLDIVASQPTGGSFTTFFGDGAGDFSRSEFVFVGGSLVSLAVSDLNADSMADVMAVSQEGRFVSAKLGRGEGKFNAAGGFGGIGISFNAPPDDLQAVDVDGDGLLDLVARSSVDNTISILRNGGVGALEMPSIINLSSSPTSLTIDDVDDDGNVDYVAVLPSSNQLQLQFGDGTATGDGAGDMLGTVNQPSGVQVADFNQDGISDLIVVGATELRVMIGDGARNFVPLAPVSLSAPATQTIVGDFNGDGISDLALGRVSPTETFVSIRLSLGDGTWSDAIDHSVGGSGVSPAAMSDLLTEDLNGDGILDLIATDPSTNSIRVLIGVGDGTFLAPVETLVGNNPVDVSVVDLNADGVLDAVVAAAVDAVANVLLGVGDGTFIDRQDHFIGANPVGVAVIDVLGDGSYNLYSVGAGSTFLNTVQSSPDPATSSGTAKLFQYDPQFSQITRLVDELGNETLIDIDPANGNGLSVTRVIGDVGGGDDLVTTYTYTPRGQIDTVTDPLGRVTDYDYDALGRLIATTFAVGTPDQALRTMEYDVAGNLTALVDELGHRTEYQFDALNRLVLSIDADPDGAGPLQSQSRAYVYDDQGNVVRISDAQSGSITYQYDDEYRMIRKTDSDGQSWSYLYDEAGNVREMTDRLGRLTTYRYDNRNRLTAQEDPEGGVQRYLYDADDNPVRRFDKNGNVWLTEFDARNRTVRQIDPLGHETRVAYDRSDNVIMTTDSLSRRSEFQYDDVYRLVSMTEPDPDGPIGPLQSPVYSFDYDKVGNQTRRIDPLGNEVTTQFDNRNRPVVETLTDPDGDGPLVSPVYRLTYDDANRLTEVIDPIDRVTTYIYDDLNRLVVAELPDPDGPGPDGAPRILKSYDTAGNLVASTDPLGNTTTYTYDTLYRLVSRRDPDPDGTGPLASPLTTFLYDAESQLVSVTDPLLRTVSYQHDLLGRVTSETYPDPDGAGADPSPVVSFQYDPVGNQIATTDPLGNTSRFQYDADLRMIQTVGPDPDGPLGAETNPVTSVLYDAADQLLESTDPLGRVTSFLYDDLGRVIRETYADPDGDGPLSAPETARRYDAIGNQISMTDALGNTTDYVYDNLYRRTHVMMPDPDGASGPQGRPTTELQYDVVNRPTVATDPLGRESLFVYDDLDRVIREVYPDPDGEGPAVSPEMVYTFDLVGNPRSMTDAVGGVTSYLYDNLYRTTSTVLADPDGAGPLESPVTTFTYDVAGQLLSVADPLGRTVSKQYDRLGRAVGVLEPDPDGGGPLAAPLTSFEFDLVGNERSMTDPLGNVTRYVYDNLYRRVSQVSEDLDGPAGPLGNPTTTYVYDLANNLTSLTDPVGNTTRWQFDDLDRNVVETITLDGTDLSRRFQYDAMNNLVSRTDRDGRVTQYDYDAIYRPVSERWLDAGLATIRTINTVYDEANQILAFDDVGIGSRYDYAYDRLGRVTTTVVENGGSAIVLDNAYDAQSRRISLSAAVGGVDDFRSSYQYDALHRLTSVQQSGQTGGRSVADKRFDYRYNPASQLVSVDRYADLVGSSPISSSDYLYDGQARLVSLQHSNSTATPIAQYTFTFDVGSRIIDTDSLVDGASAFAYDNGDQLTGAAYTSQSDETYAYDENGNRTLDGYQTGDHNRLLADGAFDYQYDNEGNRIRRTNVATGAVTEYSWDHRNRLVSITDRGTLSGPSLRSVNQRYDAFNRWISSAVDADGDGPAQEVITRYDYEGNNIILQRNAAGDVTKRFSWGVMVDQIMAEEDAATGEVLYPLGDQLGTVRDITDGAGNVVNHVKYDSYGNIDSETDAAVETLFGYTGKPLDESTGLQNNRARWYDAAVGRWTSEDPIGFAAADTNLARYAGNRPTTASDPTGEVIFFAHGIANLNVDEMDAITSALGGEGAKRQEVVHFIYGRGLDPKTGGQYPVPPTSDDAWENVNSMLNRAAGKELALVVNQTQASMNARGINEPIHVIGYSNGSNVVWEMGNNLNQPVDSTLIIGGSINKFVSQKRLARMSDKLYLFRSPGDGATKLVFGIGSRSTDDRYKYVANIIEQMVPNVFHSINEASSSHPRLTAASDIRVPGRIKMLTTGWAYDLIGFDDSFTYDEAGVTYATAWLTRYMAEKYYAPLLGLGFGEDNRFSRNGTLPNGVRLNKCDTDPSEYVFSFWGQ